MDQALLQTAIDVFLGRQVNRNVGEWATRKGGVFVTSYIQMPPTSRNVWCCMSNGEYDGKRTVLDNVVQSAYICLTTDPRRSSAPIPHYFEVTILAVRKGWRPVEQLSNGQWELYRDRHRAICVQTLESSAIYLPTVWDERPDWDSKTLIEKLTEKAGGGAETTVYEIGVYDITHSGSTNSGYLPSIEKNPVGEILLDAWKFYTEFASPDSRLPYLVKQVDSHFEVSYSGPSVRTYSDMSTFCKLAQRLQLTLPAQPYLLRLLADPFLSDDLATYAAWIQFTLDTNPVATTLKQFVEMTVRSDGLFIENDLGFGNPQVMLTLLRIAKVLPELAPQIDRSFIGFVQAYRTFLTSILLENGAFAANWILQALAEGPPIGNDLIPPCVEECFQALIAPNSLTIEACSLSGLLAVGAIDKNTVIPILQKWRNLQKQWRIGGFRYYSDQPWYRTDVTSHVIDVCLRI
jgi:hypothetical protein